MRLNLSTFSRRTPTIPVGVAEGFLVKKFTAPPTALLPNKDEAAPLTTSTPSEPFILVSFRALWLNTPKGRIGIPSSKYWYIALVPMGCRIAMLCCSLPRSFQCTPAMRLIISPTDLGLSCSHWLLLTAPIDTGVSESLVALREPDTTISSSSNTGVWAAEAWVMACKLSAKTDKENDRGIRFLFMIICI